MLWVSIWMCRRLLIDTLGYLLARDHFLARLFDLFEHRVVRDGGVDVDGLLLERHVVRGDTWVSRASDLPSSFERTRSIAPEHAEHDIFTLK